LCPSHYNKYKYRVNKAIPVDELRSDFRKISAINCKRCGSPRFLGTTSVLCYDCYLAYTRMINRRRSKKQKLACKKYDLEHKDQIREYKKKWWIKKQKLIKENSVIEGI
jgi:uncharacterized Zn finger protein (UPF0148 family)